MRARIDALHELVPLVETESSTRAALMRWQLVSAEPTIAKVSRRVRIGAPLAICLEPLRLDPDGAVIARAIDAHSRHGGSLSRTLRALVAAMECRDQLVHGSRAASSTSKLSTRLLAGLAAACALLIPAWRTPTRVMVLSSAVALVMTGVGTLWMRRLQPRPPAFDDPVASTADLLAALLDAGLNISVALDLACPSDWLRPRRLVRLGMNWPDALARHGPDGSETIASVLRGDHGSGLVASEALRWVASTRREKQRRACELETKRAPVLLVLPLTLCFLPAFALVMVIPLVRALAM